MNNRDLHVLLSFDMESDIGSWTDDYVGCAKGTGRILEILAKNQIPSTFFFTGDALRNCPESAHQVQAAGGHEIGCHTLHHESIGNASFRCPGVQPVMPEEVFNRIAKATDLVESKAGTRPVSFRAPRGWSSNEALQALEKLGYVADSSYMAACHRKHSLPYYPSAEDWTQSGDLAILEIPLFGGDMVGRERDGNDWLEDDPWIALRLKGAEAVLGMIMREAQRQHEQGNPALACFYLHPWEYIEMPRTITTDECRIEFHDLIWKNTGDASVRTLDTLITGLKAENARFHTVGNFAKLWNERSRGVEKPGDGPGRSTVAPPKGFGDCSSAERSGRVRSP
ncbi:MAG: polysaccharide deacetylase family protein [Pirellulales bacterium]|nr:polysaccharide deacetylase family protein [Pirellulales bacterium]